MKKQQIINKLKKTIPFFLLSLLLFSQYTGVSFALSDEQIKLYNQNILYYDKEACSTGFADDGSPITIVDDSIYQSGLAPPYILEQWAIHTLKAIAQKQGINEEQTVTEEHVIALVAFALGEGGDINNTSSKFNPLNTGLYAPELLDGAGAVDGTQSFKSFDAGVEGTARTMLGSNQNRLAKILSKKDSKAKDFMQALTYFNRYPGNKFWASASLPPNQDSYYNERLALINTVRGDYKDIASLVIGTDALEQAEGVRDQSKLSFGGSGNGGLADVESAGTENCSCTTLQNLEDTEVLLGENNQEKVFNFFIKKEGVSPEQAAGIVGNFMVESGPGIDPAATNGTHNGIAQWDADRWASLVEFAGDKNPRQLVVQLQFAWQESAMKEFINKNYSSPEDAAADFDAIFERSGGSALDQRKANARDVFEKYGSNNLSSSDICPGGTGKAFTADGYAWPVDISKSEVDSGYPWPCRNSCHHDGTPAFDLSTKATVREGDDKSAVGKSLFAITDGTVDNLHVYNGIEGCYSFHIKSSKDGFDYYYTHTRRPAVKSGDKVKVGDKVAEIGERKCTGNGSYPHLHIDRGSPKGSPGGSECCRDEGMVEVINALYRKLP